MNLVILSGWLGRDPDTKYMPSGDLVVNFSVGTPKRVPDGNGGYKNATEWHRCKIKDQRTAEVFSKVVTKGDAVELTGHLETRRWGQGDAAREVTEVIIHTWGFAPAKKRTEAAQSESQGVGEGSTAGVVSIGAANASYTAADEEPVM